MKYKSIALFFSVIVVLLLVFFIFNGNSPTTAFISLAGPETCEGTCTACDTFPIQATCELQDGCGWSISACTGDPIACKDLSVSDCSNHGCTWNIPALKCQGTPETCPTYNSNESLCNSGGCVWAAAGCSGVCTACTDFLAQGTCETQNGCTWDFGYVCGNNTKEGTETCDGTDLDSETCITQGFDAGTLACQADCSAFNTSSCTSDTLCGNGIKDAGEVCDGSDFGGETCITQGYNSGSLYCFWDCSALDLSDCSESDPLVPVDCTEDCCGNGLCEENQNENFTTCKTDCSNPSTISFNFYSPTEGARFPRGERLIVKVEITADSSVPLASDVEWVKATGFFGTDNLYDDGLHNDDAEGDLIYGNSFFIGKDVDATKHTLTFEAKVAATQQETNIKIIVDPVLNVEILTDKDSYVLGEMIEISGTVKRGSTPIETPISVSILSENTELSNLTENSNENGFYIINYQTEKSSPEGEWILNFETLDQYNNKGIASKTINVTTSGSGSLVTGSAISPLNVPDISFKGLFEDILSNVLLLMLLTALIVFIISIFLSGVILYFLRWKKTGFIPFPEVIQKIKTKLNSIKYFQNLKFLRK